MRGAFVACFGRVDRHDLERVAGAHRWHSGLQADYLAPRFGVVLETDPAAGPHVEQRNGTTSVVHGPSGGSFDDLRQRGTRFVVVETDGETLRAARDPMGLAPLFYRRYKDSLWLASEIAPLVALGDVSADLDALSAQAALVPDDRRTGFAGIHRLLPGHLMHVTRDLAVELRRYWDPYAIFGRFNGGRGEAREELWARLLGAVDRCSLDGPIGLLVSGGLDSTAVAAAAARLRRSMSLVHVAFPGVADAEEERFARAVAASAGAHLDVVKGEAAPWHPEEDLELSTIPYLTPPAYTANTGLAHLAGHGVTVALDGNDGDGLLGPPGREWGELMLTGEIRRLATLAAAYGARTAASGIAHDLVPPRVFDTIRRRPPGPPTYLERTARYFDQPLRARIQAVDHERWRSPFGEWRWRQLRQVLPVTTIRMEEHELRGARYGVDLRHPFADRELVEFLVSLPVAVKVDPMRSKSLLRDALRGHAPEVVLERVAKPEYLSILERRVDRGRCVTWIEESGVRLPFVDYDRLLGDASTSERVPLFLLVMLARAHVFAARV